MISLQRASPRRCGRPLVPAACASVLLGALALVSLRAPLVGPSGASADEQQLVFAGPAMASPNLTAVREQVLPLVTDAVVAAGNRSGEVGDRLLRAATSIATAHNWSEAERDRIDELAIRANESYTDLVSQAVEQVQNVAWWLGGWIDPMPQRRNLRSRLQSLITLQSRLRGVAISLSWVSESDSFTLVAGEVDGRKVSPDDVFLFGSGTKPFTACAIMRAAEAGRLKIDGLAAPLVDEGLRRLGSAATLGKLFGPRAARVTIRHLLHMSSGLADFDYPEFDNWLLEAGNANTTHSPLEFLLGAASVRPSFLCDPGECVTYSSTNYVLLGFVLLSLQPDTPNIGGGPVPAGQAEGGAAGRRQGQIPSGGPPLWWDMPEMRGVLPEDPARNLSFPRSKFLSRGPISEATTIFGRHGKPTLWPLDNDHVIDIGAQDASILGWVCGNLASTTAEVARFFWELLVEGTIVSEESVRIMSDLEPLGLGWGRGHISYGAGLMLKQTSWAHSASLGEWGAYLGHGGNTYGFLSEQVRRAPPPWNRQGARPAPLRHHPAPDALPALAPWNRQGARPASQRRHSNLTPPSLPSPCNVLLRQRQPPFPPF